MKVVDSWTGGAFHRNAGHVLQAMVEGAGHPSLAWQEYSPAFPHTRYTLGYAGRPGGPAFYVSTVDNTANHGPGSQGSATEADSCFAKLVREPIWRREPAASGATAAALSHAVASVPHSLLSSVCPSRVRPLRRGQRRSRGVIGW